MDHLSRSVEHGATTQPLDKIIKHDKDDALSIIRNGVLRSEWTFQILGHELNALLTL